MTIKILANVVDIAQDKPKPTDRFFVDTNVWFFLVYTHASLSSTSAYNQVQIYPSYLQQVLSAKASLHKCLLSYSELAHIIERTEYEIFSAVRLSNKQTAVKAKPFRHDYPVERQQVLAEIELAWLQVDAFTSGNTITFTVDQSAIDKAQVLIKQVGLDGYDLFFVDAIQSAGITQVISDDLDFGQVAGITVFTANQKLIREAKTQGKFIIR